MSWAPATQPGSVVSGGGAGSQRRFVTGGSDNTVKIWTWRCVPHPPIPAHNTTNKKNSAESGAYIEEFTLEGHTDWVRDVAWAPSILQKSYIASASQDKSVIIWTQEHSVGTNTEWSRKVIPLDTVVWRVSWSLSGNVLAVSGGDNKVTLWKETLKGEWERVSSVEE